jgi:hypothetical protein
MKKQFLSIGVVSVLVFMAIIGIKAEQQDNINVATQVAANMLMGQSGITCVGFYDNATEIYISVENASYLSSVPSTIDGYPTNVTIGGRIYAEHLSNLTILGSRTVHWSPMVGGISFGNVYYHTGTVGVFCHCSGVVVALSNAHILAMDANYNLIPGEVDSYQPGLYDSGPINVGWDMHYININFNTYQNPNHADAACAYIYSNYQTSPYKILGPNNINTYTVDLTTANPSVGYAVRKSGKTTGVTYGVVLLTNAYATVWYGNKWAYFTDLYETTRTSNNGDSGSFVDYNGHFVGLEFAGDNSHDFVCKANYIKNGLGIS